MHVHKSMGTMFGAPVQDVSECPMPECHEWDDRTEIEKAADALADAVEALVANRAWESTSAPEWKTLGDALKAYREVTKRLAHMHHTFTCEICQQARAANVQAYEKLRRKGKRLKKRRKATGSPSRPEAP